MPHRAAMLVLSWALLSPMARADDLHGFFLAPQDGGPDPLMLHRPTPYDPGEWYVSGLLELMDRTPFGLAEDVLTDGAIDGLLTLDFAAGMALSRHFRVWTAVPLYLAALSDDAQGAGLPGDLRLGLETALIRQSGPTGPALELVPHVVLPTGPERTFLGRDGLAAGLVASASLTGSRVAVVVEAGVELPDDGPTTRPLHAGAAVSTRLTTTTALVAEGRTDLALFEPLRFEALFSLRQRARRGLHWMIGSGARFDEFASTPSWRIFGGAGFGTRARDDADNDGLVDSLDACPSEPETLNGWQDLDGCPDRLADLVVLPTWRGEDIFEADAVASAGNGLVTSRPGPLVLVDRPPGEFWEVRVVEGCLTGAGSAVLHEGHNRLLIPTQPTHDATLELVVRDATGRGVGEARIEWLGSWPSACAPTGEYRHEGGRILVPLGAGWHDLRVYGPDGSSADLDLRIRRGGWQSRHITLEAPARLAAEEAQ